MCMSFFSVTPKRLTSREIISYKGYAVTLRCPVDSYPPAKIRWIRPASTFHHGDASVVTNVLSIKRVKKTHEGIYLCEGSNMFGSTYTAVFVKVRNEGKCCFCCFSIYKEKTTEKL